MKSSRIGFSISDFVYYCHLRIYLHYYDKKKEDKRKQAFMANLSPHQVS